MKPFICSSVWVLVYSILVFPALANYAESDIFQVSTEERILAGEAPYTISKREAALLSGCLNRAKARQIERLQKGLKPVGHVIHAPYLLYVVRDGRAVRVARFNDKMQPSNWALHFSEKEASWLANLYKLYTIEFPDNEPPAEN